MVEKVWKKEQLYFDLSPRLVGIKTRSRNPRGGEIDDVCLGFCSSDPLPSLLFLSYFDRKSRYFPWQMCFMMIPSSFLNSRKQKICTFPIALKKLYLDNLETDFWREYHIQNLYVFNYLWILIILSCKPSRKWVHFLINRKKPWDYRLNMASRLLWTTVHYHDLKHEPSLAVERGRTDQEIWELYGDEELLTRNRVEHW